MRAAGTAPDTAHRWYARPVFLVADVQRAARFHVEQLGFGKAWHEADGAGTVCQVRHGECEIIRGYGTLRVEDPDGNELFFPRPD